MNSNGTQYTTSDNLGSPRVITKSGGLVASRHDYMPFGGELGAGTGGRTTGMGFSNAGDTSRKKFTGYERDNETGLDFAQARYYSNTQGRFSSPDPLMASATAADPQTWNRYGYVVNNPLKFVDPSGMIMGKSKEGGAGDISVYEGTQYNRGTMYGFTESDVAEYEAAQQQQQQPQNTATQNPIRGVTGAASGAIDPCSVAIPTDSNDRAVLAMLLGEASTPGENTWSPDQAGINAYRHPSGTLSAENVYDEMLQMVAVVDHRLTDWGQREDYSNWQDVIEAPGQFLGYGNGQNILQNLGTEGSTNCVRARLGVAAINAFHGGSWTSPFYYWKGIKQQNRSGQMFIRARNGAWRWANTDFQIRE